VAEQPQEEAVETKTDAEVADTTDAKKPDAE
jgi:hypothetical protein